MADLLPRTPSPNEETLKESLDILQRQVVVYEQISKEGDDEGTALEMEDLADAMGNVGDSHTDSKARKKWHKWAKKFLTGGPEEQERILADVGKGLFLLLAIPFVVVGVAVFAAGAMLYGVGSLIKGIGNVATFGVLGRGKLGLKGTKIKLIDDSV